MLRSTVKQSIAVVVVVVVVPGIEGARSRMCGKLGSRRKGHPAGSKDEG